MTPDLEAELTNYRAHRFGITRLESGEFALFDPDGTLLAVGILSDLAPLVLTGPDHYETCAEAWGSRVRKADTESGSRLLSQLGLAQARPTVPAIIRRI